MPQTIETQVFTFDELSDDAKETARQWFREARDSSDLDSAKEDIATVLALFGFELCTHKVRLYGGGERQEPSIWWELGYSQGDGVAFESSYRYKAGFAKAVRAYAPKDETLAALAAELTALQKACGYSLTATTPSGLFYSPEVEFDRVDADYWNADAAKAFKSLHRDLCSWAYQQFRAEDEYQSSDEQVDDAITANEYTFTAEGKRFG